VSGKRNSFHSEHHLRKKQRAIGAPESLQIHQEELSLTEVGQLVHLGHSHCPHCRHKRAEPRHHFHHPGLVIDSEKSSSQLEGP
jgi:hypothetical protein